MPVGIENAFKKLEKFLAATKSPDHRYRYFNFAFACVLYNCWRLVDVLTQLEVHGSVGSEPLVTVNLFLTLAKTNYGIPPPE